MLNMKLDRPLAFFDIEATGLSPRADRIIELCIIKITPNHQRSTHTFRINPECKIPKESTAIHGITDADVADCPTFSMLAREISDLLEGCDLGGFNIARFDIPMLAEEFKRSGIPFSTESRRILDVQRIFHRMEPRDLSAALRFYCGKEHVDAHGAEADVVATIEVFDGQLERYPDLPRDMDKLDDFCNQRNPDWVDSSGKLIWQHGEVVLNFGQRRGTSLKSLIEANDGYINWMLRADFPPDTRKIIEDAQKGRWPRRNTG